MYLCQDAHVELRVPHLFSPSIWDLTQVFRHGSKCMYTLTKNTQINVQTNKQKLYLVQISSVCWSIRNVKVFIL